MVLRANTGSGDASKQGAVGQVRKQRTDYGFHSPSSRTKNAGAHHGHGYKLQA